MNNNSIENPHIVTNSRNYPNLDTETAINPLSNSNQDNRQNQYQQPIDQQIRALREKITAILDYSSSNSSITITDLVSKLQSLLPEINKLDQAITEHLDNHSSPSQDNASTNPRFLEQENSYSQSNSNRSSPFSLLSEQSSFRNDSPSLTPRKSDPSHSPSPSGLQRLSEQVAQKSPSPTSRSSYRHS